MGMIEVRALQVCFVGGARRKVGDIFRVPEGTALRSKKRPPVLELVNPPPETSEAPEPAPAPKKAMPKKAAVKKKAVPKKKAPAPEEPEDD